MIRFRKEVPRFFEQACLAHAYELFENLKTEVKLSLAQKLMMRHHLESLAANLGLLFARVTILASQLPACTKHILPIMGSRPECFYTTLKAIIDSGPWDPIDEDEDDPERYTQLFSDKTHQPDRDIFHPRELLVFVKRTIGIKLPDSHKLSRQSETKNFTMVQQQKGVRLFRTKDGESKSFELKDFWRKSGNLFTGKFCVLSATDRLLCCDEEEGEDEDERRDTSKWVFYILELQSIYSALATENTVVPIIELGAFQKCNEINPFISPQGVLVCKTTGFKQLSVQLHLLSGNQPASADNWLNLRFTPTFSQDNQLFFKTSEQKLITISRKYVYLARVGWERTVYARGVWLCVINSGASSRSLKLQHQQYMPIENTEPGDLFLTLLEVKRDRIRMIETEPSEVC